MIAWLTQNIGTILVLLILIAIVAAVTVSMVRDIPPAATAVRTVRFTEPVIKNEFFKRAGRFFRPAFLLFRRFCGTIKETEEGRRIYD